MKSSVQYPIIPQTLPSNQPIQWTFINQWTHPPPSQAKPPVNMCSKHMLGFCLRWLEKVKSTKTNGGLMAIYHCPRFKKKHLQQIQTHPWIFGCSWCLLFLLSKTFHFPPLLVLQCPFNIQSFTTKTKHTSKSIPLLFVVWCHFAVALLQGSLYILPIQTMDYKGLIPQNYHTYLCILWSPQKWVPFNVPLLSPSNHLDVPES